MIDVKGKSYEVLEILERPPYREKDLFVCMSEFGYKECFQRYDIEHQPIDRIHEHSRAWTTEEENYIREQLLKGKTVAQISHKFINPIRTLTAIEHNAYRIKRELGL